MSTIKHRVFLIYPVNYRNMVDMKTFRDGRPLMRTVVNYLKRQTSNTICSINGSSESTWSPWRKVEVTQAIPKLRSTLQLLLLFSSSRNTMHERKNVARIVFY